MQLLLFRWIQVNVNGVISFLEAVFQYTSDTFPLGDGRWLIAPYWGDVDTRNGGTVSYREVLRFSQNETLFSEVDLIIQNVFIDMKVRGYSSSWMFIATWNEVAFYGTLDDTIVSSGCPQTGERSIFVIFDIRKYKIFWFHPIKHRILKRMIPRSLKLVEQFWWQFALHSRDISVRDNVFFWLPYIVARKPIDVFSDFHTLLPGSPLMFFSDFHTLLPGSPLMFFSDFHTLLPASPLICANNRTKRELMDSYTRRK